MDEILAKLEPQDLLKFGLIPELIGRLPIISTLEMLDKTALVRILSEPKNAILKQYSKLFELDGVKLEGPTMLWRLSHRRRLTVKPAREACVLS